MATEFVLRPSAPYDFAKMIRRLRGSRHELYRLEGEAVRRTIRIGERAVLLDVRATGTIEAPELTIRAHTRDEAGLNETETILLRNRLMRMFAVGGQWGDFARWIESHPRLRPLGVAQRGLRMWLDPDPFECLIRTIIGQQLNLAFASTLCSRLMECATEPFDLDGARYPVFPTARELARLTWEDLRELQFSRHKAEYVIDAARLAAEGRVVLDDLETADNADVFARLLPLRGIGRWTVECFLLFGLGRADVLPAADIGLRNAVRKLYGLDRQPDEAEVRALGEEWAPWSGYVTFYLWESLSLPDTADLLSIST